jgi:CHASE3 domain sensor protein
MKEFFRKHVIKIGVAIIFLLIVTGATFSYYNKIVMNNSLVVKSQTDEVLNQIDLLQDNIRFMDISGRGYALIHEPQFLFWPLENAQRQNTIIFKKLDSLFAIQKLEDPGYPKLKDAMHHYTKVYGQMIDHLDNGDTTGYLRMLAFDYGKVFYQTFEPFFVSISKVESEINQTAQTHYENAILRNNFVQFLLVVAGLPILLLILRKISKDEQARTSLLLDLDKNNKTYLFHDGNENAKEPREILGNSITNLQKAAAFVNKISEGNYDASWEGLTPLNEPLNKQNLAGRLVFMRDEMKRVKEEDAKRMWATQGISEFSEIIRKHQNDLEALTFNAITFLVKYTRSQQGCFFVLEDKQDEEPFLKLAACYAFERRKHIERRVEIGEGLLGQTFLEGEPQVLKQVPPDFIRITSGLGDATPTCVVIVPLKYNERVYALIELASFSEFVPHQVVFLEKAGEFVASAIASAKQNANNKFMLDELKSKTEQMRAQEEELRQNLEELEATQEAMKRKQVDADRGASRLSLN